MISSLDNPRVKSARALARAATRRAEGLFLAEGPRVVMEALSSDAEVVRVFVIDDPDIERVRDAAAQRGTESIEVSDGVMRALSTTTTPQGCVAVVRMPATSVMELPRQIRIGLILAGVSDPGNAGTLLRSAAGAGADCVIVTRSSVDPFNPKVVRSSAGTIFGTRLITGVTLEEVADAVGARGCTLVGADANAGAPCYETDLTRDLCFVLGNEARGLADMGSSLDEFVRIPLPGGIESLNVAVAGSLLLFEAARQRASSAPRLSSLGND